MTGILLVDDHEVVRHGLRTVLGRAFPDAELGEAGDAAEGLRLLEAGGWHVVLLDINLPGRGGLELLEELRQRWPALPVVVLTAYPEEELAVRCVRLGASAYLTKSSASAELVAAVRKVLEGGRYITASLAEHLAATLGGETQEAPHQALSVRELQVLRGVAAGLTLKELAANMGLSVKTISTYRSRIGEKLAISRSADLVRYAIKHGLVE